MSFDPTIAAIRFGMGLSPNIPAPASVDEMLALLTGPDDAAVLAPIPTYADVYPSALDFNEASRALNAARGTDSEEAAEAAQNQMRADGRDAVVTFLKAEIARAVHTQDGLRERLTRFWADHFTVRAAGISRHLVSSYIEEAIRPHVNGSFADMLVAVVGSPLMILYLDQHQSMGPNSPTAQQRDRGLNENLAREMLELHTLGVDGTYTQTDVRELAELLTGVTANARNGAFFREQQAEPGSETVLGVTYGGSEESLEHVHAALRDLAVHPDTARHLARKLVVHFVTPNPDPALVDAMASAYLASGGRMISLYEVMLNDTAVWGAEALKVKQPFDFIASSMRALAVPLDVIQSANLQDARNLLIRPLSVMGQDWQAPVGPNGWPEEAESWITPQGMAGRITWSMRAPERLLHRLPDPRDFVHHALGSTPPDPVVFAANAAETIGDGIGIVLASAAFQRR